MKWVVAGEYKVRFRVEVEARSGEDAMQRAANLTYADVLRGDPGAVVEVDIIDAEMERSGAKEGSR